MTNLQTLSISFLALGFGVVSGCGYGHDAASYFSENWETDYVEIEACKVTAHPRGGYIRTMLSPEAQTAFCAGDPLPDGTVIVKEQWDEDPGCAPGSWDLFTVMKKNGDSWDWQTVGGGGGVVGTSGPNASCSNCHEATCGADRCVQGSPICP